MLQQRLAVVCLLFLFIGIVVAQQDRYSANRRNNDDDDDDEEDNNGGNQKKQIQPAQKPSVLGDGSQTGSRQYADVQSAQKQPPVVRVGGPRTTPRVPTTPLASSPACQADVAKHCNRGNTALISNLKVLQCVDELDNAVNLINKECQNLIYSFKYHMTHDIRFDDAATKQCSKDIKILQECQDFLDDRGTGRLVTCLYDRLGNITEPSCRYFINQMQVVIFTDWQLSEYFIESCKADIDKNSCGRLDDDNEALKHEQGAVVSCLSSKFRDLATECKKQIFRLAEMQSEDYHLDRALFYACRDDRERLCASVSAGNGRVYRCLYEHKFDAMMSNACRTQVHRRQLLMVQNVMIDVPFTRACASEIREHKCQGAIQGSDNQLSLVNLLLCLEDVLKKGNHIQDECRREMLIHRRMLMSDYALSPEIVSKCKVEMTEHCASLFQQGASGSIEQRSGKMLHCLFNAARLHKQPQFNPECLAVVNSLLRAVNPGEDIRADPLLESACRPVIDSACSTMKPGESHVIMCLLDNLKNSRMTEVCEDRLMEIAYFMARDWRLTPRLMRSCRVNLKTYCQLPEDWSMAKEMTDVQVGMYLGCLYQNRDKLERECGTELKRLMRLRTQSIGLMPEIEDNCLTDLATCKDVDRKGEELKCLQNKYEHLEEKCKLAVKNFTQITMSDPSLDFLLMKACEPMIQLFCSNVENGQENDVIRCLIDHKNEQRMDFRCRAGIDHHQIMGLKDEAFLSQQFRIKCSSEINEHCQGKNTRAKVIQCLADLMLRDVLQKKNEIRDVCRDELKYELLQRSENINFDPLLAKACQDDVRKFCSDRTPGNAQILDCLKDNRRKVSAQCYAKLKKREKVDIVAPENDYSLMSKCANVIQKYCSNEKKQNILSCLRRNINQDAMGVACRRVLYHRLMILNSDVRFNKALIENCQTDINIHCQSKVVDNLDDDKSDEDDLDDKTETNNNPVDNAQGDDNAEVWDRDMGGRLIECLRSKYADTAVTLQPTCAAELIDVIQTSKLDIKLDPKLYQKCGHVLARKCPTEDKEDCLKLLYQHHELEDDACREQVVRIIKEGRADIHVDRALSFACQADIMKYCNDVPLGSGKQLQCLLSYNEKSLTGQCRKMLLARKELWGDVSKVEGVVDLTRQIQKSNNSTYLFTVVLLILCVMFMAGCVCRPYIRYNRASKYK